MTEGLIEERRYDRLRVSIFADAAALGAYAAAELAEIIRAAVAERGAAHLILATGNSQLAFLEALRGRDDVPWAKVIIMHMDEYLGMPAGHPASFRRYLHANIVDHVHPAAFYGIVGDATDPQAELRRYAALLARYPADACVLGIGENGHLAFNDPPADFETAETIHIVNLDEACRRQQVGEGHFATLADTPQQAMSLTVPALLAARRVLGVVPEQRKAAAVRAALTGPVTPNCPASLLQRQPHAHVLLDCASAALLDA